MRFIFTFILTITLFNVIGQTNDTLELISSYNDLKIRNSKANQENYFEKFPNDFYSLNEFFGNQSSAPLSYKSLEYISVFFKLDSLDLDKQIERWIDISVDGIWDSDGISYFQNELKNQIFLNVNLSCQILKGRTDKDIKGYFYFFFCGNHVQYKTIPKTGKAQGLRHKNLQINETWT